MCNGIEDLMFVQKYTCIELAVESNIPLYIKLNFTQVADGRGPV